jgi:hypothetical protein
MLVWMDGFEHRFIGWMHECAAFDPQLSLREKVRLKAVRVASISLATRTVRF